jgi:hypothetical protein
MHSVSVFSKPAYVHGLSLKDAITRVSEPDASDRTVVIGRSVIRIETGEAPLGFERCTMLIMIDGAYSEALAAKVYKTALAVITSFLPPNRNPPQLRVRFTGTSN